MHKAQDDVMARTVAERTIGDLIAPTTDGAVDDLARTVVGAFEAVQFEETTTKARGAEVRLRRLVITGPWEVAPSQGQ